MRPGPASQQIGDGQHCRGYSYKDTPAKAKQFWRIAMGSANEMVEHLETAAALGYAPQATCQPYIEQYTIVAKQLNRLIQKWRKL